MLRKISMVTGGARSGKSSFALGLAMKYGQKVFLATSEAFDSEMRERIRLHREERGKDFITVEEPLKLGTAFKNIPKGTEVVLLDCITVWLGNLMHHYGADFRKQPEISDFLDALKNPPCSVIAVTNEVGSGIVPGDPLSRAFRDQAGRINQSVAAIADEVYLVVSGIPMKLKG